MDPSPQLSPAARATRSSTIRDLLRLADAPGMLSLAGGLPGTELLPARRLGAAASAVFGDERRATAALQYGPTEGIDELRAVLGHRLDVGPGEVLVTTGSQQGLDLVVGTLVGPGDVVVTEAPSYLGALQRAEAAGARIVTVPGDGDGLDPAALERLLAGGTRPALCYVVSNFANPSGATLSAVRRRHLAELATRHGFVVVDDDPYGELRFEGAGPAALRAGAPDWTISLGSASKVLSPGARVGWLTAPDRLLGPLVRAKQIADLHTPGLTQLMVADVLADEAFMAAHLRRLRATYRRRCTVLLDALRRHLGDAIELPTPEGGMFLWARLPGRDTTALLPLALERGVAFVPGAAFAPAAPTGGGTDGAVSSHLRLCFTTLDEAELDEAARRLAVAAGQAAVRPRRSASRMAAAG